MEYEVMLEKIGAKIHAEMNHKNWNIKRLAIESGVDEKIISRLLHFRGNPRLRTLDKIATALGLTLENLCGQNHQK